DDERIGVQTPCVNRHYAARGVMGRYSGSTIYPVQAKLLEAVLAGDCFQGDELPIVPDDMRKPPPFRSSGGDFLDEIGFE
ncbi:hypothetical protein JW916_16580, partial [Candidatus Sumerlaeota bacterium]|nr:hypothetical protein [Candidatus Sumerlaeota bacterium]